MRNVPKANDTVVKVERLRLSYGRLEAVCGLSLEMRRGELFGMLARAVVRWEPRFA